MKSRQYNSRYPDDDIRRTAFFIPLQGIACSFENNTFNVKGRDESQLKNNTCVCIRKPFVILLIIYAEKTAKRARCHAADF